jgi:hypothetical protein
MAALRIALSLIVLWGSPVSALPTLQMTREHQWAEHALTVA